MTNLRTSKGVARPQTERERIARAENTRIAYAKIIEKLKAYGSPMTAEGIAEEANYPEQFLYKTMPILEGRGLVRQVPDPDGLKLYEAV